MADTIDDKSAIEDKKLDIGDMTSFLGEDDVVEDVKTDKEPEDDKEVDDKEDEEKIDLDPENDEELKFEDVPKLKTISKEFPDLLKKFPALKSVYYREQQYSEIYPTIQAARESVEKANQYDAFENSLLDGNITDILSSVKTADPKAFTKLTEHMLTMIGEVDKNAQFAIAGRVIKDVAIAMARNGDENEKLAARYLHKFIFKDDKISGYKLETELKPLVKQDNDLNQREQEFIQYQLDTAVSNVNTRVENLLSKSIHEVIDTRDQMTPYVKDKAVKDILAALDSEIGQDRRFKQSLDLFWEEAGKNRFNEQELAKIRNAVIRKAKPILPAIIRRVKAEALKGSAARSNRDDEDSKPLPRGRMAPSSNSSKSSNNRTGDTKNKIPRGMSTRDYLMSDD